MGDLENGYKINRYFYMDSNQKILKYKKYCIISDCGKNASFNYKDLKDPIYFTPISYIYISYISYIYTLIN